jgi:non-heme chloroperoxidase
LKTYTVIGGSGTKLHVEEYGKPSGHPILFIHGLSQCRLTWQKQINSNLANDFRLVALDLRGHGFSEKPKSGYDQTNNWAEDIQAVILTLNLFQPLLVASSYGGLIICDYLRVHGEQYIAGINFVDVFTSFGTEESANFLSPESKALFPGLISTDAETSSNALQEFIRLAFYHEPALTDYYFMLGFNTIVPPYVRAESLSRSISNDDILAQIKKPVLISHGIHDKLVLVSTASYIAERIPQAKLSLYENVSHIPYFENAARFNHELKCFRYSI